MTSRRIAPILLILLGISIAACLVIVSATRILTHLEGMLFQLLALGIGLYGSYIFGRQSASDTAREIIRPHARSAIRRIRSLSSGLGRIAIAIERCESPEEYRVTLARLEAIVTEQSVTTDDALEDWADIVPEDVAELRKELSTGEQGSVNDG